MRRIVPLGPQVLRLVGPHARLLPVIVLLGLVSAGLEGVGIGLIMPLLDIMMDRNAAAGHGLAGLFLRFGSQLPTPNRLALIAGAIVLLVVLKNAVAAANAVLSGWVYGKAGHAIRTGLTRRLTDIGYAFFKEQSPGRLLNVISTESWRASDALATALTMVISASVTAVLFLFLCLLSWRLTLAVAVGLALIQLVQALASGRLRSMSRGVTENNSRLASRMLHLVDGARLIRVFGQTAFERSRFDEASEAVRLRLFQLERRRVIIPPVMEALYAILFVGIIVAAWTAGVNFSLVAAFVVLLYRMQPNVRNIQSASAQLHSLSGSVEAVEWLLDPSGKPVQPSGSIAADDSLKHAIRFENVSFRFPNDADGPAVLQEASFEFRAGRSTALVGRSGAGKTTIINLLCRFLEPDSGAIWVDGRRLTELDTDSWRRQLGVASQDLDLIDATVAQNIAYGRAGASMEQVRRAAEMADAHAFIARLPEGYDTLTGHRGAHLSAGQRQRVALARALLRDPPVLILDEATSAVDGISERSIIETLKSRAGRATTIVISHHRKTLAFCDDVVIVRDGRIQASMPLGQLQGADMDALYRHGSTTTAA